MADYLPSASLFAELPRDRVNVPLNIKYFALRVNGLDGEDWNGREHWQLRAEFLGELPALTKLTVTVEGDKMTFRYDYRPMKTKETVRELMGIIEDEFNDFRTRGILRVGDTTHRKDDFEG